MGSLNMHLCLANKLKEKFGLNNDFVFGQVLPDLRVKKGENSTQVHYLREHVSLGYLRRLPYIEKFIEENKMRLENSDKITLGYLAHLVQDRIWFNEFIPTYAKYIDNDRSVVFDIAQNRNIKTSEFSRRISHDYIEIDAYEVLKNNFTTEFFREELLSVPAAKEYKEIILEKVRIDTKHENVRNYYITKEDADVFMKVAFKESVKVLKQF